MLGLLLPLFLNDQVWFKASEDAVAGVTVCPLSTRPLTFVLSKCFLEGRHCDCGISIHISPQRSELPGAPPPLARPSGPGPMNSPIQCL